jgi:MSP (Major sperm protein) domain
VKTTQPRRYLVRPNQGLIAPDCSETISILLVEKDKQILLQSYDRLGQSGLDHSKDKFLVQSCIVNSAFSAKLRGDSNELYEALTSMWNSVTAGGSTTPLFNKKLHVRHTVAEGGGAATTSRGVTAASFKPEGASTANLDNMTQDQLTSELSNLRRKYDELVSFSVNLTAERDILSNTLEQTKRDYNREMAARSALENKQGGGSAARGRASSTSLKGLLIQFMIIALAGLLYGVKLGQEGKMTFLQYLPFIGEYFVLEEEVVEEAEAVTEEIVEAAAVPPTVGEL